LTAPRALTAARSRPKRCLGVGLALASVVALAASAPPPAGAAVSFSTAPNAPNLPSVTLNAQAKTVNATMANWGVSQTSTQSGWNVTVQGDASGGKSPVFKVYCPNTTCGTDTGPAYVTGGSTLPANSLKLNSTGAGWTTGTGTKPTHSCNSGCNVDASAPVKVASATTAVGLTTWTTATYSATSLALSVPTTIRTPAQTGEVYHLDLVWTLNTGP
jgi:hypothetical protein